MAYVASGRPGAPVGVGQRLVRVHVGAVELVGRELVDRVVHERAQDRHPTSDRAGVRAEVAGQVDLQRGDRAALVGGQRDRLPLVTAVMRGDQRLRAGLGVLARLADAPRREHRDDLLRHRLQLAAEAAAHIGRHYPDLALGNAQHHGQEEPRDVRDLGRGPQRHLLAGRVAEERAGLHERRDQPLLPVLPLEQDPVGAGLRDRLVDRPAGARLGRVELPERGLVRAEVRMGENGVRGCLLEVERRGQLFVVDVHQLGGVLGLRGGPGHDHGHHLAGERHPVDCYRRPVRCLLVGRDRPRGGYAALLVGDVGPGDHRDDVGSRLRRGGVDARDAGVRERAAHHGEVQHAGRLQVVGPPGPARDQSLVLLAAPVPADLGCGPLHGGGHDVAPAACCTAFTMLW